MNIHYCHTYVFIDYLSFVMLSKKTQPNNKPELLKIIPTANYVIESSYYFWHKVKLLNNHEKSLNSLEKNFYINNWTNYLTCKIGFNDEQYDIIKNYFCNYPHLLNTLFVNKDDMLEMKYTKFSFSQMQFDYINNHTDKMRYIYGFVLPILNFKLVVISDDEVMIDSICSWYKSPHPLSAYFRLGWSMDMNVDDVKNCSIWLNQIQLKLLE